MSLILVDGLKDRPGTGGPKFPNGLHLPAGIGITGDGHINMAGVCTFSGNVTIGGTLTYEDVTNIDSVGVVTARSGVNVSGGEFKVGTAITVGSAGVSTFSGNVNLNGVSSFAGGVGIADSIFHSGDTNTAIRFPSADTVTVETSGSERARIDSSGRLLLGTATANSSDRFTIVDPGNAFISLRSDAEADGNSQIIDFAVGTGDRSSSNLVSSITSAIPTGAAAGGTLKGHLAFSTNSGDSLSERLRLDSSGDLLLGTTTSAGKLTVDSGTSNTCATFQSSDAGAGINVKDNSARSSIEQNGVSLKISSDTGAEHANSDIRFQVDASTKVTIDSSGRILQGKTSTKGSTGENVPTFCNELASANPNVFEIANNGTNANSYPALVLSRSDGGSVNSHTAVDSGDQIGELCFIGADGSDRFNTATAIKAFASSDFTANDCPAYLSFFTNGGSASASERLRINHNGQVLIGTSDGTTIGTINTNLVVGSTTNNDEVALTLNVMEGTNGRRVKFFLDDDDGVYGVDTTASTGVAPFVFRVSGTEKMRLNNDGDLLVARTTSVHGGVFCVDYTNGTSAGMAVKDTLSSGTGTILHCVNGSGTVVGSISQDQSNVTYGGTSDYRLKENVVSISDGITRLKTLKPSRFNWIADSSNTTIDGFLAHEASTAVPESVVGEKDAVATEDSGIATKGDPIYQQMDNAKLVPLLTAALQEAITKIETLETKVAALESS